MSAKTNTVLLPGKVAEAQASKIEKLGLPEPTIKQAGKGTSVVFEGVTASQLTKLKKALGKQASVALVKTTEVKAEVTPDPKPAPKPKRGKVAKADGDKLTADLDKIAAEINAVVNEDAAEQLA